MGTSPSPLWTLLGVLLCFCSFNTAERTIQGTEAANMMRKGQIKRLDGKDAVGQMKFIESLFGMAA